MKSRLIAAALFSVTAVGVLVYPAYQSIGAIPVVNIDPVLALPPVNPLTNERPVIEVVFVLDTTGSMSGLIQAAKEKIWSIATSMASAQPAPQIRIGLVAYRDRGDAYVTRRVDLSEDLDSVYATLMDFQADGGGDSPESVNQALYEAVHDIGWSQGQDAYKVVFLVGDAPPHMDYQDDIKYPVAIQAAVQKGIAINAIQCGQDGTTRDQWQHIASLGQGSYFEVGQAGSAVAIASPFDQKLAELSEKLDSTRLFYGNEDEQEKQRLKAQAADKLHKLSSPESRARRAVFNSSASGKENFFGDKELVDDVSSGRVDLSTIAPASLPEPLRAMAPAKQKTLIEKTARQRGELQKQIRSLSEQRSSYLKDKVTALGGAKDSLDYKIFSAVREQAAGKGLLYEADTPDY